MRTLRLCSRFPPPLLPCFFGVDRIACCYVLFFHPLSFEGAFNVPCTIPTIPASFSSPSPGCTNKSIPRPGYPPLLLYDTYPAWRYLSLLFTRFSILQSHSFVFRPVSHLIPTSVLLVHCKHSTSPSTLQASIVRIFLPLPLEIHVIIILDPSRTRTRLTSSCIVYVYVHGAVRYPVCLHTPDRPRASMLSLSRDLRALACPFAGRGVTPDVSRMGFLSFGTLPMEEGRKLRVDLNLGLFSILLSLRQELGISGTHTDVRMYGRG
jgi:hypothetical protein